MKRLTAVLLVALMAVAGAAIAYGATPKKQRDVTGNLEVRVLKSAGNVVISTGTTTGTFGSGVVRVNVTPSGDHFNFKGTGFFRNGSISVTGTNKGTPRPDGSGTDFTGTFKIGGGTGRFKGATGSGTLTGSSQASDASFATYRLTGKARY